MPDATHQDLKNYHFLTQHRSPVRYLWYAMTLKRLLGLPHILHDAFVMVLCRLWMCRIYMKSTAFNCQWRCRS